MGPDKLDAAAAAAPPPRSRCLRRGRDGVPTEAAAATTTFANKGSENLTRYVTI